MPPIGFFRPYSDATNDAAHANADSRTSAEGSTTITGNGSLTGSSIAISNQLYSGSFFRTNSSAPAKHSQDSFGHYPSHFRKANLCLKELDPEKILEMIKQLAGGSPGAEEKLALMVIQALQYKAANQNLGNSAYSLQNLVDKIESKYFRPSIKPEVINRPNQLRDTPRLVRN